MSYVSREINSYETMLLYGFHYFFRWDCRLYLSLGSRQGQHASSRIGLHTDMMTAVRTIDSVFAEAQETWLTSWEVSQCLLPVWLSVCLRVLSSWSDLSTTGTVIWRPVLWGLACGWPTPLPIPTKIIFVNNIRCSNNIVIVETRLLRHILSFANTPVTKK